VIRPRSVARAARQQAERDRPDSRNLKTTRGWVQGYNAQATVTAEQIVVAAEISVESLDTANLQPMVEWTVGGPPARVPATPPGSGLPRLDAR
jgi:hypothetical protein